MKFTGNANAGGSVNGSVNDRANGSVKITKNSKKIFEILQRDGSLTVEQIVSELKVSARTVLRSLKQLKDNDLIERDIGKSNDEVHG